MHHINRRFRDASIIASAGQGYRLLLVVIKTLAARKLDQAAAMQNAASSVKPSRGAGLSEAGSGTVDTPMAGIRDRLS